jgi:hypothetical protein
VILKCFRRKARSSVSTIELQQWNFSSDKSWIDVFIIPLPSFIVVFVKWLGLFMGLIILYFLFMFLFFLVSSLLCSLSRVTRCVFDTFLWCCMGRGDLLCCLLLLFLVIE